MRSILKCKKEEELLRRGVPADHIICKRYTEMDIPENITATPKYVVTLNDMDAGIENGIKIVHLQDFLLAETW